MATIKCFEDLEIWQLARDICKDIHRITGYKSFKSDYGLVNQINRSYGSIMDNIAEGFEREGNKEFKQYLSIAKASAGETRSQLYRSFDRKYISKEEFERNKNKLLEESIKIKRFMDYLRNSEIKGNKFK